MKVNTSNRRPSSQSFSQAIRWTFFLFTLSVPLASSGQIELKAIEVQEQFESSFSDLLGFEQIPPDKLPLSVSDFSAQQMQEHNVHRLADLTRLDASTTDSYNATGYWDILSIRGYTLDNRSNFRREGLPISAETAIPLENKAQVEVLKGLGAVQAGASSPGGLVNYVVKRPTGKTQRDIRTEVSDSGNLLVAADVGGISGSNGRIGYRVNVAQEQLRPHLKNANGDRSLVSLAADLRLPESSLLEGEVEWSRRSQPSQPGFSLLGSRLPSPGDPNLNLNNQPWTQPVVFSGLTGTLRYTQALESSWSWSAMAGVQSLGTDDRLAYPFGCSAENNFDRFCSDGTFDLYDYRSDNESRITQAAKLSLQGQIKTETIQHDLSVGLIGSSQRERYQRQAYNFVGVGNVNGTAVLPANPTLSDESTQRDAGSVEAFVHDAVKWGSWRLWLGARANYLDRQSVRTDGSRPTSYSQSFVIPWGALAYEFDKALAYLSMGDGLESFVTPNKTGYSHPGEFLQDVRSHQVEVGARGGELVKWNVAIFQIRRPVVVDQSPHFQVDGEDEHRGLELQALAPLGSWDLEVSAMGLRAERTHSVLTPSVNGKKPVNVPENTLRFGVGYRVPAVQGLSLNTRLVHEGERAVLADNSIMLPEWTRLDAGVTYASRWWGAPTVARLSVENLLDRRYWRESPTQYGHIYLYPGESRNILLSLEASL